MWTRYIPLILRLNRMLAEGALGEVQLLTACLGMNPGVLPPTHYMFKPELGGGILLDVGVYPISLASMVFHVQPAHIAGLASFEGGVDQQDVLAFDYPGGQKASMVFTLKSRIPPEFSIYGTSGRIRVHPPLFRPDQMTLTTNEGREELIEEPVEGNGWNYQAVEVGECLRAGKLESARMPLDETLAIMQTLDRVRAQWNFKYPFE
jgi:predicted dehydrogenase